MFLECWPLLLGPSVKSARKGYEEKQGHANMRSPT